MQAWQTACLAGVSAGAATRAICTEFGVSTSTVWQWRKRIKGVPRELWVCYLAPEFTGNVTRADIDAESLELLKADYLRPEQPTKAACIRRLRESARPGAVLPSDRTMARILDSIPRVTAEIKRRGRQAVEHLYPAQQRLKSTLRALEQINGDGYMHNLWVRFPDGEVRRPKTWVWQDIYSSRVLTWRTDKTEHTDVIRLSFGDLIEQYGIPDRVTIDNTMAAANKTMTGGAKFRNRYRVNTEEALGVFTLVNTEVKFTKVRWGQSKPIERINGIGGLGEYIDKAPELAGAWTGSSPLDKPEYDGKTRVIDLADLERVIEREIKALNARTGRKGAMHKGGSFDELFNASYSTIIPRRATEAQRRFWLLAAETVRAKASNGEITLGAGRITGERIANRYWDAALADYAGRELVARFDPAKLHDGVHVYTMDGRYICFAACVEAAGFNDQNAGREHNRARTQFVRASKIAADAETRMTVLEVAKAYATNTTAVIPPASAHAANVVRGSFGDLLKHRAPREDTPEEAAAREQLAAEMSAANVVPLREREVDDWELYNRCEEICARIAAGEPVADSERDWCESYMKSSSYSTCKLLAVDFPHMVRARAVS